MELSLAPMLKVTNPEFRLLISKVSPQVTLFTEMIVANTVIHVDSVKLKHILGVPDNNTIVQIGGSKIEEVADAVLKLKSLGWTRFNLNCGCPSTRVQSGCFGAVLMLDPVKVASIINEVYQKAEIVLSLKIRTGVDENDSFEFLENFIKYIKIHTQCRTFYIHARKCWLKGVNPKKNRTVPPLNYKYVYDIKKLHPELSIHINGGIKEGKISDFEGLDGIMIGRGAVNNINIFNDFLKTTVSLRDVVKEYLNESLIRSYRKRSVLNTLNNIRKCQKNNKLYKKELQNILKNDNITLDKVYDQIKDFFD